jgi:hypothetical protein
MTAKTKPTPRVRQRKRALDIPDKPAEGFIYVKRVAYNREEETQEQIRVPDLVTLLAGGAPAKVRVGAGITKNLGDFNSARVDVVMELPCLPEIGEMRRVAELISAQLDELIPSELEKAMTPPGIGQ